VSLVHQVYQELPELQVTLVKTEPPDPKVHLGLLEHQEHQVIPERREILVLLVFLEQLVFLELLVYLDHRVLPERVDQRLYRQISPSSVKERKDGCSASNTNCSRSRTPSGVVKITSPALKYLLD
jgi:hypothetical protein